MSTSHTEQLLKLSLDHPSHLDTGRRSFSAGVLVGFVSGFAISSYMGTQFSIYAGVFIGAFTTALLHFWMRSRAKKRKSKQMADTRQARDIERSRQMAAAKASGAFDRFGTRIETE